MAKKCKKDGRVREPAEIQATAASRREANAWTAHNRQGDPRLVQSSQTPAGRTLSSDNVTPVDVEFAGSIEHQKQAFVEKFGREPGPDDAVFFNPEGGDQAVMNADTPSLPAKPGSTPRSSPHGPSSVTLPPRRTHTC